MAIQQKFCANHPQRPALGICVMTRQPICGECSTRYEGVNYSREGLRMLQAQRAAAAARAAGKGAKAVAALAWCLSPLLLYLVYLGYLTAADVLMSLLHREL